MNQLAEIAAGFGLDMSQEDLSNQREAMRGAIANLRHIDDMPEDRPPVAYPRTSGYRPHPDENPYNAWYWRAEIKGADAGPLAGEEIGIKDVVSVAPSSRAPASEVITPPPKSATTARPSRRANCIGVGVHSAGIGDLLCN